MIRVYCDICEKDITKEAREVSLLLDKRLIRNISSCAECSAKILKTFEPRK